MIYVINENVIYNEKTCSLEHIVDPGSRRVLLKPAGRLLSLFLMNNNVLLTRDQLLNDVWEDYGLKASNNNLNNYIYSLRKALSQFGEEKLLVTYQRRGFKFAARTIRQSDVFEEEVDQLENEKTKRGGFRWARWWIESLLAITAVGCLAVVSADTFYSRGAPGHMISQGKYKNCRIYSTKNDGIEPEELNGMVYHARYDCSAPTNVYYYGNIKERGSTTNVSILTYCPLEKQRPCENIYVKAN